MVERKKYRPLRPVEKFEMRQFREAGMTMAECASYFDCSLASAHRALAEMRAKFGPEKLPRTRRHYARWHLHTNLRDANTQPKTAEKPA